MTGLSDAALSRRDFFHCAACAGAVSSLGAVPFAHAATMALQGKEAVHEFPYGAVRLIFVHHISVWMHNIAGEQKELFRFVIVACPD